jgi:predicted nucleotidyltransferase
MKLSNDALVAKLREQLGDDVTLLRCVEIGSRARRLGSPLSDYDVSFIYARRLRSYLSLNSLAANKSAKAMRLTAIPFQDSCAVHKIEQNSPSSSSSSSSSSSASSSKKQKGQELQELDAIGWDLPHAVNLLLDLNLSVVDCLCHESAAYDLGDARREQIDSIVDQLRELVLARVHSARGNAQLAVQLYRKAVSHEKRFFRDGFWSSAAVAKHQAVVVHHKKYFYVIQPLLRLIAFMRDPRTVPVLDVESVRPPLGSVPPLDALIERKRSGELAASSEPAPTIDALDEWLRAQFAELLGEHASLLTQSPPPAAAADNALAQRFDALCTDAIIAMARRHNEL